MTLQRKILLTILTIAVLPMATVGLALYLHEVAQRRGAHDETLVSHSRQIANDVATGVEAQIEAARTGTLVPQFAAYLSTEPGGRASMESAVIDRLRRVVASDPVNMLNCALLDAQGQVVAQTTSFDARLSEAHTQHFQQAMETGLPSVSSTPWIDADGRPALCVAAPVRNTSGDIVGVLRLQYAVSWLQQLTRAEADFFGEGTYAVLLGPRGQVLANTEPLSVKLRTGVPIGNRADQTLVPIAAGFPADEPTGPLWVTSLREGESSDRRAALAEVAGRPWRVMVWQDKPVFESSARAVARLGLLASILAIALLAAASLLLARSIARPVTELTEAARRIAAGDVSVQLPAEMPGELGTLADAIVTMASNLQGIVDGLEERHGEHLRTAASLRQMTIEQNAILESARYAIISMGLDGVIRTFNPSAETMLGFKSCDVCGIVNPTHFLDGAEVAARGAHVSAELGVPVEGIEALVARPARGLVEEREWTMVRRDGGRFTAQMAITVIRDDGGDAVGYLAIANDVTARKKAKEELIRARDAAEAASVAKSQFLANMSHEIRTPMNAIIGFVDQLGDGDAEVQAERIGIIQRNAGHLLHIVNDVLDISRLDAGSLKPEIAECAPLAIVNDLLKLYCPRARELALELDVKLLSPVPELVRTDAARLRQILSNLVSNALKFTEKGGVTITARSSRGAAPDRRTLVFEVRDTGVGIDPAKITELFKPFTQADSSMSRRHGGTGLGLAIAGRLAQLLGGEVVVASEPGKGSTFSVSISVECVPGAKDLLTLEQSCGTTPATPSGPALSGRVLLVEDGLDNQRLISLLLRKCGLEVTLAENGEAAIALLSRDNDPNGELLTPCPFDLVFMDMQMPVMDGYTATGCLRARGSRAAIVALTAHAMEGDRQRCIDAGCTDYATKPVDRATLGKIAAKWLGREHVPEPVAGAGSGAPV